MVFTMWIVLLASGFERDYRLDILLNFRVIHDIYYKVGIDVDYFIHDLIYLPKDSKYTRHYCDKYKKVHGREVITYLRWEISKPSVVFG